MYEFSDSYNFSTYSYFNYYLESPQDSSARSFFIAYIIFRSAETDFYFQVPGIGAYGTSNYQVNHMIYDKEVNLRIAKISGPGETYDKVKIFRVYANHLGKGVEPKYNGYTEAQLKSMDYETFIKAMGIQ